MNPIGQAFPVINRAYAFSSYFDQPPQLLNVVSFRTFSDKRFNHLLLSTHSNSNDHQRISYRSGNIS